VVGPVPASVYAAIRASGPCVYCGGAAGTADHVRPLSRGGAEHESNLVPACGPCNAAKSDSLLTEWRRADLVARAVACSPAVAAEWARLTGEAAGRGH
jgi:5-methylcytosine-specific restriction endonuclease McrA